MTQEELAALKAAQERLKEKTETYSNLVQSLQTEIDQGQITISQMKNRLTVNMVDKILFASGRTELKPTSKRPIAIAVAVRVTWRDSVDSALRNLRRAGVL